VEQAAYRKKPRHFISKKYIYKKNIVVYGFVLDGIATAIGEVGISDYMAYIFKHPRYRQ
jgi:uncharacterized membrane protein